MPLNLADKNKIYIIQRIVGNKDMVHRLQSLGFVVGSKISVLSGHFLLAISCIMPLESFWHLRFGIIGHSVNISA